MYAKQILTFVFLGLVVHSSGFAQDSTERSVASEPTTEEKMVRMEFRGQPWPDALQWLAETSELNLDWQELPDGVLNLASSKEYTLAEAHDLINMQLLARGFTLLVHGEVLRVAKLATLDPTLVKRIKPEELESLPPHQFARVSFPMDWMIADEAAEEFASLLSPYGKLHAMSSTNRLEAVDAAVNLRTLHRLLEKAEADEGRRERIVEFPMKHRRAEEIAPKVRQLLGLSPAETAEALVPTQLDLEKTRFRNEAIKQLGAGAEPLLDERPVMHLIVNEEENSIVVNARADQIEVARQVIETLDKPLPEKQAMWENSSRIRTFDAQGFDVATLLRFVASLQEDRKLAKETRVEHDTGYNRIIVFGPPEDQLTVAELLDSFKAESRSAQVIPLVSLDPYYATQAVQTVLKNPARPSAVPGSASDGTFQIEPDPNNDRLLLWATPQETDEVKAFLAKLGESFVARDAGQSLHVVSTNGVRLAMLEERFESMWQRVSDVPLMIEKSDDAPPPTAEPVSPSDEASEHSTANPPPDPPAAPGDKLVVAAQFTSTEAPAGEAAAPAEANAGSETNTPPVVHIIESADGKVLISSQDTQAAAAAKTLLEGIVPPAATVRLVKLEHADAPAVREQLMAVLAKADTTPSSTLAPKQPYSIETDLRSNTLILQNLSAEQLRLVERMTPLLDTPKPKDEQVQRVQEIYQVQNAKSIELAETIKEVYRDLLSSSDKTFAANNVERQLGYAGGRAAEIDGEPQYQGLLSVSADEESNKLILSAPAYLIDEVLALVKRLDTGPADSSIGVVQLSPGMDPQAIMKALSEVLANE